MLKRHIYPSQDSVGINEIIQELYIYDGERGIYIKNEPTAAYPTSLTYKGSTLYNMRVSEFCTIRITKTGSYPAYHPVSFSRR